MIYMSLYRKSSAKLEKILLVWHSRGGAIILSGTEDLTSTLNLFWKLYVRLGLLSSREMKSHWQLELIRGAPAAHLWFNVAPKEPSCLH